LAVDNEAIELGIGAVTLEATLREQLRPGMSPLYGTSDTIGDAS
jgi:hypothetical protein